jgi:hypothetical protein
MGYSNALARTSMPAHSKRLSATLHQSGGGHNANAAVAALREEIRAKM